MSYQSPHSADANATNIRRPPAVGTGLRPLTNRERGRHLRRFIFQSRRTQIVGTILILVLLTLAVILIPRLRPPAEILSPAADWISWGEILQTFFGLATFLIAGFVWYNSLAEEWAGKLPQILSCYFFRDRQPALICYHAYLAGEADIRAWSQQLGGIQMTGENIFFRAIVDSRPIELLTDGRAVYVHHQVRFSLTKIPKRVDEADAAIGENACLVWYPRINIEPPKPSEAIAAAKALSLPGVGTWDGPRNAGGLKPE